MGRKTNICLKKCKATSYIGSEMAIPYVFREFASYR